MRRLAALADGLALAFACAGALPCPKAGNAPQPGRILDISFSAAPAELVEPGEVTLSFTVTNSSQYDAENVYISSADGLSTEPLGQIDAGDSRVFSRVHEVTEEELENGRISYTFSTTAWPAMRTRSITPWTAPSSAPSPSRAWNSPASSPAPTRARRCGDHRPTACATRATCPSPTCAWTTRPGEYSGRADEPGGRAGRACSPASVTVDDTTALRAAPALYRVPAEGNARIRRTRSIEARILLADEQLTATLTLDRETARVGETVDGHADRHQPGQRRLLRRGRLRRELRRPHRRRPGPCAPARRRSPSPANTPVRERRRATRLRVRALSLLRAPTVEDAHRAGLPARPARARTRRRGRPLRPSPSTRRSPPPATRPWTSTSPMQRRLPRARAALSRSRNGHRHCRYAPSALLAGSVSPPTGASMCPYRRTGELALFSLTLHRRRRRRPHTPFRARTCGASRSTRAGQRAGRARRQAAPYSGQSVKLRENPTFWFLILLGGAGAVLVALAVALFITSRKQRRQRRGKLAQQRRQRREELGKTNRFTLLCKRRPAQG